MTQSDQEEPFLITEEIEAEMIVVGHVLEPPPIACTGRLRDVLALQSGEIADQEYEHGRVRMLTTDERAELRQDMAKASAWMRAELARRRAMKK